MATNARFEFVRLRNRDSNGLQNLDNSGWGSQVSVNKNLTGTALTGAGRVTAPANVNGYTSFHLKYHATVESLISKAPAGDAGTSYDAALNLAGCLAIPANTIVFLPCKAGELFSAATGLTFA